jgi:hypothetical protein
MNWYFYIDYGSGYVLLDPKDVNVELAIEVDQEINDYVKRKVVSGNFKLYDTEANTAKTYFVDNGNDSAPFRLYENGIMGVGTLQFQGFVNIKAEYDFRQTLITFDSFKTDDAYSDLLKIIKDDSTIIESLSMSGDFRHFYSQGQHANCNKLQGYSLSGSNYATTGNALTLYNVGRVAMCINGTGIAVYDNITKEIRRYNYSAPDWSLSSLGTSYDLTVVLGNFVGNGALCDTSASQIAFIDDYYSTLMFLTATTGTYTLDLSKEIEDVSRPSMALITSSGTTYIALVDSGTQKLRAFNTSGNNIGNSLSLGNIENPTICSLDSGTNSRIALLDSKTNSIQCYTFDGSNFTELGTALKISESYEPQINYESANNIIVIDTISGKIERYAFSGTAWSETGTGTSISGGYMGAGALDGSVLGVIQTDNFAFKCSRTNTYKELLNAVLSDKSTGLSVVSTPGISFDIENICIGELDNLTEINSDPVPINYTKLKIIDLLKLAELWQRYWYIDGSNIKFTKPDRFSDVGTNFDISSLQRGSLYVAEENNRRSYSENFNINKEKLKFKNERNTEFVGLPIDYDRDNENEINYSFNYTADFEFIVDWFTKQTQNLQKSGLFLAFVEDDADNHKYIPSSVGQISSADTRNNDISKSDIMENYWKDYRYSNIKNFYVNGNSRSPDLTVRDMIRFPDIQLTYGDLGLAQFPSSVGSLTWDTGVASWITRFAINLRTEAVTISSRLLDL